MSESFSPFDPSIVADILPMATVREQEPMSRHTTLRVGGPARYFWPVSEVDALIETLPNSGRQIFPISLWGTVPTC